MMVEMIKIKQMAPSQKKIRLFWQKKYFEHWMRLTTSSVVRGKKSETNVEGKIMQRVAATLFCDLAQTAYLSLSNV